MLVSGDRHHASLFHKRVFFAELQMTRIRSGSSCSCFELQIVLLCGSSLVLFTLALLLCVRSSPLRLFLLRVRVWSPHLSPCHHYQASLFPFLLHLLAVRPCQSAVLGFERCSFARNCDLGNPDGTGLAIAPVTSYRESRLLFCS